MSRIEKKLRRLREEAESTYREYGRVKELHRADRSNPALIDRLTALRTRYELLENHLSVSDGKLETLEDSGLDLSRLEPQPSRAFGAGGYTPQKNSFPVMEGVFTVAKGIRIGISLLALAAVVMVLLLISNEKLGFYIVPSSSMEPTLLPNDRLAAYWANHYERGEVVVLRDPDDSEGYLVKRIVAIEGDQVAVNRGRLNVNGVIVNEPYLNEEISYSLRPIRVGPGEVFLLGDNRNESHDGHIWKRAMPKESIMGSVRGIYAPASRMRARIAYTDVFSAVPNGQP